MNHQNPTLKKNMIAALGKSLGIVSTACASVGINRSTHYDWLKNDPDYKQEVADISEAAIDFAESKLMEKMNGVVINTDKKDNEGNPIVYKREPSDTALIFYLKTKGKSRGYVERQEILTAESPLEDLLKPTDE